jgi:predicted 2-oxoglutarate/Fe(II)-dependent dioxygenase YbiX
VIVNEPFGLVTAEPGSFASQELMLSCYGVEIRVVDAAGLGACDRLRATLPLEFVVSGDLSALAVTYVVTAGSADEAGSDAYHVTCNEEHRHQGSEREGMLRWLGSEIDRTVAEHSPEGLFVHAGVVAWRERAILVPGRSTTGKSTLVEELVRRGAMYYSDEYAVLDDEGRVHPYARLPVLRDGAGQPRPVALDELRARGPAEPLPVTLVMSTCYRPGAVWRPAIVRGSRAVLPVIDNTVLARSQSARTLRLAARLAPTVVTLHGARPEAREVAPRLLDLLDDALVSRSFGAAERGDPTRHLAAVARVRLRPPPGKTAAVGTVRPARYVRIPEFLSPAEHRRLLDHARARRADFEGSEVLGDDGTSRVDRQFRRSRTLYDLDAVWDLFEPRLRGMLPHVRRELGLPWFPVDSIERQLTAHEEGDLFGPHTDSGHAPVASRRLSCVYHFHRTPQRFAGGDLRLYNTTVTETGPEPASSYTTLTPLDNSAVFFASDTLHEVCPVHRETQAFEDSRFAVTIWYREGSWPSWRLRHGGPRGAPQAP